MPSVTHNEKKKSVDRRKKNAELFNSTNSSAFVYSVDGDLSMLGVNRISDLKLLKLSGKTEFECSIFFIEAVLFRSHLSLPALQAASAFIGNDFTKSARGMGSKKTSKQCGERNVRQQHKGKRLMKVA